IGATGATGATGAKGKTGAKGNTGATGRAGTVTCRAYRAHRNGRRNVPTRVRCVLTFAAGARLTRWSLRITHRRTLARAVVLRHHGRIAVHLGAVRPVLRPGTYALTVGRRTWRLRIVRARS